MSAENVKNVSVDDSNQCLSRDSNGRPNAAPRKEEQQSHLLDLLDISLGATSISSPPLGAAVGAAVDPWAAANQRSDPWAGNSQPQADPWQTSAAAAPPPRTIMSAGVPLGAVVPAQSMGAPNDAWGLRAHSPSVASGSSNEGWLQTNGNANQNGRVSAAGAAAPVDAWLTKTTAAPAFAAPAAAPRVATNGSSADPWLAEAQPVAAPAAATSADPWAAAQPATAALDDPWKALQTGAVKVS